MPKATEAAAPKRAPVSVEKIKRAQGADPYVTGEDKRPVKVPMGPGIKQPVPKSRFPEPEVEVEALERGIEDRGFTFGRGGQWLTTRARAEELAGQIKIIREL